MTEWNPVEGLKEIKYEDLREGDEVVMFSFNEYYRRVTIDHIGRFGYNNKYYLLQRPVEEPINRGDVVKIYLRDDSREALVESYIRVRSKFRDEDLNDDEAWTSVRNNVAIPWERIVSKLRENSNYRLRSYRATYEQVE